MLLFAVLVNFFNSSFKVIISCFFNLSFTLIVFPNVTFSSSSSLSSLSSLSLSSLSLSSLSSLFADNPSIKLFKSISLLPPFPYFPPSNSSTSFSISIKSFISSLFINVIIFAAGFLSISENTDSLSLTTSCFFVFNLHKLFICSLFIKSPVAIPWVNLIIASI